MDFDALMSKKLGGKYLKPSQVEKKVQEHIGSAKDGEDEIVLTPPPKEIPTKTQNLGPKRATLKPRVMSSQCDFVRLDGKEMQMHRKKHETSFDCKECTAVYFVPNYLGLYSVKVISTENSVQRLRNKKFN